MSEIPDRIMEEARRTLRAVTRAKAKRLSAAEVIASALLAAELRGREMEREEIIQLAELGEYAREIGTIYRKDGEPSKHDRCIHDAYMYEDCEPCLVAAIRSRTTEG